MERSHRDPNLQKGDRNLLENYRLISLTCVCCKLLEHSICTHIRHHLDTQNILSKLQHGFRSRHSRVSQLSPCTTKSHIEINGPKLTWLFWIFSKAFDTVPHQRINTITNKCNSKLGFLRRNLSRCPQKLKETAYLSLAPHIC